MDIKIIGIDLAKNTFQLCAVDAHQQVLFNRSVSRGKLAQVMSQLSPCLVAMEACSSAHYWGRAFAQMGHDVRLLPPQHVKAFARVHKSDAHDALAIAEAALRPRLHPVPVKSIGQQDLQLLNHHRQRLIEQRTATANQIRAIAREYGVFFALRLASLRSQLPLALEDAENGLSPTARELLADARDHLLHLDAQLQALQQRLVEFAASDPAFTRLHSIPGFGPVVSASLLGAIGHGQQFRNGRQLAAWVGLVPRQHGSGGKTQLHGITKNGDRHLRMMLIHGARSVFHWCDRRDDALGVWVRQLKQRRGSHKTIVALANKLVRIAWHVVAKEQNFVLSRAFAGNT